MGFCGIIYIDIEWVRIPYIIIPSFIHNIPYIYILIIMGQNFAMKKHDTMKYCLSEFCNEKNMKP
jgi:hypothetical protein